MTTTLATEGVESTRWARFWSTQSSALNSNEANEHIDRYAAELRLLFADIEPSRVLELGCGDGALLASLGFLDVPRYLGVDFSARMLEELRNRHPDADVVCAPGHTFETDEQFDLVFSAATVQFFDHEMLGQHLERSARMLATGGRIVCASVPWRRLRWAYARADVLRRPRRPLPLAVLAHAKRMIRDNMGYWHDIPDVRKLARGSGLDVEFYGSVFYPYRFHFVLRRTGE